MKQDKSQKRLFPLPFQQFQAVFHSLPTLLLFQKAIGQGKDE